MDTKLTADEISALHSLDPANSGAGLTYREGGLPPRLFAFNLVARKQCGAPVLTKSGERALFREQCIAHLLSLGRGEAPLMANGVRKWLLSSGFIAADDAQQSPPAITPRGKLWLASFEEDPAADVAEPTAADFALRRA